MEHGTCDALALSEDLQDLRGQCKQQIKFALVLRKVPRPGAGVRAQRVPNEGGAWSITPPRNALRGGAP